MTHVPWEADRVWRRLRAVVPERAGIFILDGTSFPKQRTASVGVARQYCGALGKIANCQVAVTAALWTGVRAWCLGAALYLPEEWLTRAARARARIPVTVPFQEKWRLALRLLRQTRASGLTLTAVLADAEFGDVTAFPAALHRLRLPYAVGISSHLTVFATRPRLVRPEPTPRGRPRTRWRMVRDVAPIAVRALIATLPRSAWRRVTWRNHLAEAPRPIHGRAHHARSRLAPWPPRSRDLAALRRRSGPHTPAEVLLRPSAGGGIVARAGPV